MPQGITLTPAKNTDVGNQMQARAWADANSSVVDHISLMVTMPEYRQQLVHLNLQSSFSCGCNGPRATSGLTKASNFVTIVDPWRYPHDDTPGSLKVISCMQSVVAQAAHAGKTLRKFSDASISDFLLSPLLVQKGEISLLLSTSQGRNRALNLQERLSH